MGASASVIARSRLCGSGPPTGQPEAGARVAIGRISTSARATAVASDVGVGDGIAEGGAVIGGAEIVGLGVWTGLLGTLPIGDADKDAVLEQAVKRTMPTIIATRGRIWSHLPGHATHEPGAWCR
jgi:hypothetical protein